MLGPLYNEPFHGYQLLLVKVILTMLKHYSSMEFNRIRVLDDYHYTRYVTLSSGL